MEKIKVFQGGTLLDGNGGDPIEESVIVIEGTKFVEVGKKGQVNIKEGDNIEFIDTTGKTVLPGLIDTHIHSCMGSAPPASFATPPVTMNKMEMLMRAIPRVKAMLVMGITCVRDGGSGWGWYEVALRDAIERGDIEGPRYQAAGYHVTVTGGHGCFLPPHIGRLGIEEQVGVYADGPDEWRKAVRMQIWNGVDNIKIVCSRDLISVGDPTHSQPTYEEISAAVDEAKSRDKTVIAHAQGREAIMKAVKAGADVIVHGFFMDEECAGLMAEKGVYWEPTNAYAKHMRDCALHEVPEKYLKIFPNILPEWMYEKSLLNWADKEKNFKNLLNTGVKVLMGTDVGVPYIFYGQNTVELEVNMLLGMSANEALLGCTKYAAESMRIADKLGTVEAGKLADLVIVDGNPLEDITILQQEEKVKMVLKNGQTVITR